MIGTCENCDRQNVPLSVGAIAGCESAQCYICQGDTDADPYGEITAASFPVMFAEALVVGFTIAAAIVLSGIGSGSI